MSFESDIDSIPFEKLKGKYWGFGGNCGQVALAIYELLKDRYEISFIVYSDYEGAENISPRILQENESMIYHVGIFVHENDDVGVFVDGDGETDWEKIETDIMDWYGLTERPSRFIFKYDRDFHSLMDNDTNWTTSWKEFLELLKS